MADEPMEIHYRDCPAMRGGECNCATTTRLAAASPRASLDVDALTEAVQRAMTDTGKSVDYTPLAEAVAREYRAIIEADR